MSTITRHHSDARLSRAVVHNGVVYLAGTTADTRGASSKVQTEEILAKIDALLKLSGSDKSRLLSAVVYVADMRVKPGMDEAWMAWMGAGHSPARATVVARLGSADTLVEIMCGAAK